jgi:hypothetical protein
MADYRRVVRVADDDVFEPEELVVVIPAAVLDVRRPDLSPRTSTVVLMTCVS